VSNAPADTNDKPLIEQLKGFSGIYWTANWMELVERFAYYGVRVVLPVFMVLAVEEGGPEFDHIQKGTIYAVWALVQSFVPIFSGGFADRYGYKINIALSTVLKIIGYLLMGYCIALSAAFVGMPLAEARPQGLDKTYEFFFLGAIFLAAGTAIFKPGVQGLIANQLPKQGSSLGWAVFYQFVNIGGFIGPLLAGYLRVLSWEYVFLACSAGIALNFIPLFFFKEPEHHGDGHDATPLDLVKQAVYGLLEPRLFYFTICFAGFWLMFYQLFDILPNFIDDWVDSRTAAAFLQSLLGESVVPIVNGGNLTQEWMINVNAMMISLTAFFFGYLTGKVRSLLAVVIGIAISGVGIYGLGLSMSGGWILLMIVIFSIGEMWASPTKMRFLASITPPGKEGLYMGYANMTTGIGWSIGSIIAGELYQTGGDKVVLARRYLVEELGQDAAVVDGLSKTEVLPMLQGLAEVDAWGARELLWTAYDPGSMWAIFTIIGASSLIGLFFYDRLVQSAEADPEHSFNTRGHLWVRGLLFPIVGALIYASYAALYIKGYSLQQALAPIVMAMLFALLLVASFFPQAEPNAKTSDA
jgi:dipeptide/tripeptide permease